MQNCVEVVVLLGLGELLEVLGLDVLRGELEGQGHLINALEEVRCVRVEVAGVVAQRSYF